MPQPKPTTPARAVTDIQQKRLVELQQLAQAVTEQAQAHRAALSAEDKARLELLEYAVRLIGPEALKALAEGIRVGHVRRRLPDGGSDVLWDMLSDSGVEKRGILLAGDTAPRELLSSAPAGEYAGRGVYLMEDGTFLELTYTGAWSRQGEEPARWRATAREVPAARVAASWPLDAMLEALHRKLSAHNRERATKAAEARTARLAAILNLLEVRE